MESLSFDCSEDCFARAFSEQFWDWFDQEMDALKKNLTEKQFRAVIACKGAKTMKDAARKAEQLPVNYKKRIQQIAKKIKNKVPPLSSYSS
jgi:hypothetical protein